MVVVWIAACVVIALAAWLGFWMLVTLLVGKSERQRQFLAGTVPTNAPDGFYNGSAYLLGNRPVPWLGKSFEKENRKGFNIFTPPGVSILKLLTPFYRRFSVNSDGTSNAYYFDTRVGRGYRDKDIDVLKLDYDSDENPFLIRIILDEVVEIAPDELLGKVHLKVFPGYYATIGYFGLRKPQNRHQ